MTPEQRAKTICCINDDNGLCCQRATGGICYEHSQIANAIREAVAEERAACAKAARQIAVDLMRGPQFEGYGRMAEVAEKVNQAILARG